MSRLVATMIVGLGLLSVSADAGEPLAAPAIHAVKPLFTVEEVAAYKPKGATKCFRHLCYDYNWPGRRLADLPLKFTEADPVELAEFSKKIHLDAVLLLAVPHHGYCTYETKVGVKFPGVQGDWYGRCIQELHKRNIAVLGYITLGHTGSSCATTTASPSFIPASTGTASWMASSA